MEALSQDTPGSSPQPSKLKSFFLALWKCWNPLTNLRDLLVPPAKQREAPLDGLRTLACVWIIFYHTIILFPRFYLSDENDSVFLAMMTGMNFKPFMNGDYGVDVFFALSGYLIMSILLHELSPLKKWLAPWPQQSQIQNHPPERGQNNVQQAGIDGPEEDHDDETRPLLKELENGRPNTGSGAAAEGVQEREGACARILLGLKLVGKFFGKRYFRIMPAYVAAGIVAYFLLVNVRCLRCYTVSSYCEENWWWNLLFANNFIPFNQMCMTWSWSIAVEFQMYLISPLVVIPIIWRPVLARPLLLILAAISIVLYEVLVWHYPDLIPFLDYVYARPYTRAFPYFFGMLVAVLIKDERERKRPEVSPGLEAERSVWVRLVFPYTAKVLAIAVTVCLLFVRVDDEGVAEVIATFPGRPLFAICNSYLMWDLLTERTPNDLLKRGYSWFLSNRVMFTLAQLTYSMYLLHIIFIVPVYPYIAKAMTSINIHFGVILLAFLMYISMAATGALIVYFVIEKPMINAGAMLFSNKERR